MPIVATSSDHTHAMQCLEIWGGHGAAETMLEVPGMDVWVSSKPYRNAAAGGDIHYFSMCGAGRISRFVLADVSGHGDLVDGPADLLHRLMRKYIRTLDQTAFAVTLNQEFGSVASGGRFATALLATYFAPTKELLVCNLGHPRPAWYHADTQAWKMLDPAMANPGDEPHNLPLGIIEGTAYRQFSVRLAPGDRLLLYTDSLTEAKAPDGRMLGEPGLLGLIGDLDPAVSPARFGAGILDAVSNHRGRREPDDDETLVVLHHNGSPPPKRSVGQKIRVIARMLGLGLGRT